MQQIRPRAMSAMLCLVFGLTHCSDGHEETLPPGGLSGSGGTSGQGTAGTNVSGGGNGAAPSGGAAGVTSSGGAGTPQGGASGGTGALGGSSGTSGTAAAAGSSNDAGNGGNMPSGGTGGAAGSTAGAGSSSGGSAGAGGTAGTAGASGAGGSAGGAGSAGSSCVSGGVLCDGFESYGSGSPPGGAWTASARGGGAIVVDGSRAFSGKQSLHVTGTLNAARANITAPVQTQSAVLHVRFMMYTVSYPASSGVHTRLARLGLASAANGAPDSAYALATYNGTAIEKVNSIYLRDTGTKMNASNLTGRWVCWEFGIDKTGGTGNVEVELRVNGNALSLSPAGSSSHGMTSPSWDPIPFEMFMLGLDGFQSDAMAADFWIDDLLITPERVGCPTAP